MVTVTQPKIDNQYERVYTAIVIKSKYYGRYFITSRIGKRGFTYWLGSEVLKPDAQTIYAYKGVSVFGLDKVRGALSKLNDGKRVNLERILAG